MAGLAAPLSPYLSLNTSTHAPPGPATLEEVLGLPAEVLPPEDAVTLDDLCHRCSAEHPPANATTTNLVVLPAERAPASNARRARDSGASPHLRRASPTRVEAARRPRRA